MEPIRGESVAIPPLDILKIQILNRRDGVLTAIEQHEERAIRTGDLETGSHRVRGKIQGFYFALEPAIKRWLKKDEFDLMKREINISYTEALKAFRKINELLDTKHITRIDMEKSYDQTSIEEENTIKGV